MQSNNRILLFMVSLVIFAMCLPGGDSSPGVKNIIFMVPDGMGFANVTAARIYAHGAGGQRLRFETMEQIGYQSTHAKNSMITDSAAAASAWACGEKFRNGEISYHPERGIAPETILELAKKLGKGTGLVTTSTVTHATPAAFAAHTRSRQLQGEIARQYIEETEVDVILGAGRTIFNPMPSGFEHHGAHGDLTAAAVQKGYSVVFTREQMLAAAPSGKLLGLFGENSLVPHCRRGESEMAAQQPRLSEMTRRALSTLERNPKGFFLLIEGSQIDWANHDNDLEYMIGEILTFDRAVGVVLDWVKAERTRSGETLIIVVPDHDTGGLSITGAPVPSLTESGHHVRPGWISGTHTGQDTMIWSQGPYSEHLGRAIDNTDVFHIMKAALLGKPYLRNQSIFDIPAPSR